MKTFKYVYKSVMQKTYYSHIPNMQAWIMGGETRNCKNRVPPIASQTHGLSQKSRGF